MIVIANQASPEQLRARLERGRSSAADRHANRKRAAKRPGKGNRNAWRQEVR